MPEDEFDRVVDEALARLPDELAEAIDNVAIFSEPRHPTDDTLYGLYEGIPMPERTSASYAGALPDRITLFREPLTRDFGHDRELLRHQIAVTVLHELAHHFGIDEARLTQLGWS